MAYASPAETRIKISTLVLNYQAYVEVMYPFRLNKKALPSEGRVT